MIKITEFQIENVKRIRAVDITPAEGLTVLGGNNRQGKTSILDAIAYALGGEKLCPSEVQNREGVSDASIIVKLNNGLTVSRTGKNHALKVSDPSGKKAGQTLLNSFISEFSLNLPKFLQSDAKKKAKTLLDTLGIADKLEALEKEERIAADERLLEGREADRKKAYAEALPEFPDVPDEPLSGAEMAKEIADALAQNAANQARRDRRASIVETIESRQTELARAQEAYEACKTRLNEAMAELNSDEEIPEDIDITTTQAKLEEIDAINSKIRTNAEKAKAKDEAEQAKEAYAAAGRKVNAIREKRMSFLKSVKMPLEGLTIEDGELVYGGSKWDGMSSMERVMVGISIVQALQPQCGFVLLDQLECFDAEQLARLRDWLDKRNLQAIATRVAVDDTCDIIIEDGLVKQDKTVKPNNDLLEF